MHTLLSHITVHAGNTKILSLPINIKQILKLMIMNVSMTTLLMPSCWSCCDKSKHSTNRTILL